MPRTRKAQQTVVPTTSLVASAVKYPGKLTRLYLPSTAWQVDAWRFYDLIPELRFAAGWIANALSRVELFPAEVDDNGIRQRSDDPQIADVLQSVFHGKDGQAQMLGSLGLHLTVAGEGFLVGRHVGTETEMVWEVVGVTEVKVTGSTWTLEYEGQLAITLSDDDVVIRIWRPHPAHRLQADSPVRALLGVLREIENLTKHVFLQTTSRLVGSGILPLPQSVTFPPAEGTESTGNAATDFMATLTQVMSAAIKDPDSAAALTPIVITVPDAALGSLREPLHFWSPFDEKAVETRSAAVRRFAVGMDLPPEVILGMTNNAGGGDSSGSANHWTAWQIEESAIKLHIEPLVELIVSGVTLSYVRPVTENPRAAIGYDTTALRLQPDRSKEAIELFDRGELKAATMRTETGFSDGDSPDDTERKYRLLYKLATGSATPEQVGAALAELGIHLDVPADQGPTREARPTPSLEGHPLPRTQPKAAALLPTAEVLVFRALERAGNRMRNTGIKPPGVPAHETYLYVESNGSTAKLLDGAWSFVPTVEGVDSAKLTAALESYTTMLMKEQVAHSPALLGKYLELV
jgi:hypothetical protein